MQKDIEHEKKQLTGRIIEIQRMSTEDGPGIRSTVFFKGCTLACEWCHNPESIPSRLQIQWVGSRCIGCQSCLQACEQNALSFDTDAITINREKCIGCGACVEACPSTAMETIGEDWSVDALLHEVLKDRTYFEKSNGGVTASGGEAAMQAEFVASFFQRLQAEGVHTALDTCGMVGKSALEKILPHTDMVLFDLKAIDEEQHKRFTGKAPKPIHDNLIFIKQWIQEHSNPSALWLRTPIIPQRTADAGIVREIGEFIAEYIGAHFERWELCSFNNLCKDKYLRLGRKWVFHDAELIERGTMENLVEIAKQSGVAASKVHWSGSVKEENDELSQARKKAGEPIGASCSSLPKPKGSSNS